MKIWTTCTLVSMLLFFPVGSCITDNQFNYPDKVTFPKEGGTVTVYGSNSWFRELDIKTHGGDRGYHDSIKSKDPENGVDTLLVRKDWLSVKNPDDKAELIITAEPNKGKRSRKLYIDNYTGYDRTRITVIQE